MREMHVELDRAVLDAYGWQDIDPDHGLHTFRKMQRWTVGPSARIELLDRLLEENHIDALLRDIHSRRIACSHGGGWDDLGTSRESGRTVLPQLPTRLERWTVHSRAAPRRVARVAGFTTVSLIEESPSGCHDSPSS